MAKKQKSETPLLPLQPETKGRIYEVKNFAKYLCELDGKITMTTPIKYPEGGNAFK